MEQPRICVYTCNHQREAVMAGKQAIEFPIWLARCSSYLQILEKQDFLSFSLLTRTEREKRINMH